MNKVYLLSIQKNAFLKAKQQKNKNNLLKFYINLIKLINIILYKKLNIKKKPSKFFRFTRPFFSF